MGGILRLIWSRLNQIWTFVACNRLIWIVIIHRAELLAWRCNRSVYLLGGLRIKVASNSSLITTCDRALDLFGALTLSDVVAKWGLLLWWTVFAVPYRDRRSLTIPRAWSHLLVGLLRFCVGTLQAITVILAAISNMESLTLELLSTHLLSTASNELWSTCWSFLQCVLDPNNFLILRTQDGTLSGIRLSPCSVVLVQITRYCRANNCRAFVLTFD